MLALLAAVVITSLPESIQLYTTDRAALTRRHDLRLAPETWKRLAAFDQSWLDALNGVNYEKLDVDGRIDYTLFRDHLQFQIRESARQQQRIAAVGHLLPFAPALLGLEQDRQAMRFAEPERAAALLHEIRSRIGNTTPRGEDKLLANRAALFAQDYRRTLKRWFDFYHGYDPQFAWWAAQPYKALDEALDAYSKFLREKVTGIAPDDRDTITGDPVGRDALLAELRHEFIPYTPEELIEIANAEFAWCGREMRKASRELGHGDDWKKALEQVKRQYM
ncbi:MAG: DUF885 family protein, partial [Bryobacteraceae bacterium]|nr:DUF885 family protein [Bryobacteraceae bacterium]